MEIPNHIKEKVRTIIAKSLMIPEDTVLLSSTLMYDLEAESIDILDIRFGIEQEFGFKFDNHEIRENLKKMADGTNFTEQDIPVLFTVESLCNYVVYKLEQKNAKQPTK